MPSDAATCANTLEVVHVRLAGVNPRELVDAIMESVRSDPAADDSMLEGVRFYRRKELETDLAVLILHRGRSKHGQPSGLGLRLRAALRAHGLVEHTVWEEIR